MMDSGSTALRDIHGLDAIPWWPLAPGWWFIIVVTGLLLCFIGIRYWLTCYTGWFGWRGEAQRELRLLKKTLNSEEPYGVACRLSELLRRIAMAHSGRQQTAGLTGEEWLQWLATHDNSGYDWERHGQILITAPYMPPTTSIERHELATLITAATRWLKVSAAATEKSGSDVRGVSRV
jgi:hypothetical protein